MTIIHTLTEDASNHEIIYCGNQILRLVHDWRTMNHSLIPTNLDTQENCEKYKIASQLLEEFIEFYIGRGKSSIKIFQKQQLGNSLDVNSFDIFETVLKKNLDTQDNLYYKFETVNPQTWINI